MPTYSLSAKILSFLCLLVLPLSVYAPKGEVILLGLTGLGLLIIAARDKQLANLFRSPLAIILVLALFWSAASTLWALNIRDALDTWTSITLLFVGIVVAAGSARRLSAQDREQVGKWAVRGLWLALCLLAMELFLDMPLARIFRNYPGGLPYRPQTIFNASLGMVAITLWPSIIWLWQQQKKLAATLTVLAAFVIIFQGEGDSAKLALGITTLMFFLTMVTGKNGINVLAALVVIGVLVAPILPLKVISEAQIEANFPALKHSALHRIKIWEFTATNITDKPFTGWGLDSSRNIPGGNNTIKGSKVLAETYMPLHPHNGVLQVWLELGAPGAALMAALILICLLGLRKFGALNRAGATAALAGALTIVCLSFGIWQSWWIASLGVMGLLTMLQTSDLEPDTQTL
ncbi:MAG: O-antigen ligase family protein [Alphaproteobacteria bacterium]|jgi:exopolysaccharide production protein ExoQ|nr:O-antigen ligase family protein [Alphaproteobacteria bacterium]MBT4020626.1 O-antigen ligase family protein [Alphaproteobacteria bacterium]MBT4965841.1 O-antigen ligase family protein [Alphaproteobacteria bacterium]MBT5918742.1 O-antigen ligase family protein [Alphaproteobacteria bacterium]MBT6386379.1 O-antigen ligase family protein [Alphaproteobacteria bacterium]